MLHFASTASRSRFWRAVGSSSLAIASCALLPQSGAIAQSITLDNTLVPAQTLTGPNYRITPNEGITLNGNQFHSFGQFGLNTGETAAFFSAPTTRNIITRVTGGTASNIDGLLFTQSANVNLYFINPNGIVFGPNARLDIGGPNGRGAFIATTTDALLWGSEANQFSARNPAGPSSLLSLVGDPSGFLASQTRPGGISVLGAGDPSSEGLSVFPDQRLLLLGGDVSVNGGVLRARGGRIEIGAIAGAGTIGLDLNTTDVSLQFPDNVARANVFFDRGFAITNATTGDGGDIAIQAGTIRLTNFTQLQAIALGNGTAGDVLLRATESISLESDSTVFSTLEDGAQGRGGDIRVQTPRLEMSGGAQLQTAVKGGSNGVAGIVFVDTDGGSVTLSGRSTTTGLPTAMFSSLSEDSSNTFSGGDFAGNVFGALLGETNAEITGSVFISTGSLTLENGARLDSSTFGNGNAGSVVVLAKDVTFRNGGVISSIVGPRANGNGGGVVIGTDNLTIEGEDTGITTTTLGNGDAGLIFVLAKDRIFVNGPGSGFESKVVSGVNQDGGGIILSSRSLILRNGGIISVNNEGTGQAGAIAIFARGVWLDRSSRISATTLSGEGGDVRLRVGALVLTNTSNITTEAGTAQSGGNGGNILVNGSGFLFGSDRAFIVSGRPVANSNIVANAFTGNGGSIFVNAFKLSGIAQRPEVTATNDIDASSRFGLNGTTTISVLDIDPERGTVPLPAGLADASQLIAEGCDSRGKLALGRFVNAGRGGVPASPIDALTSDTIVAEWITLEKNTTAQRSPQPDSASLDTAIAPPQTSSGTLVPPPANSVAPISENSEKIVEAQGWIVDQDGSVVLVAAASPSTSPFQIPWLEGGTCRVP